VATAGRDARVFDRAAAPRRRLPRDNVASVRNLNLYYGASSRRCSTLT
jgi:hypothetical protein